MKGICSLGLFAAGVKEIRRVYRVENMGEKMVKLFPGNIFRIRLYERHKRIVSHFIVYAYRWSGFGYRKYCGLV